MNPGRGWCAVAAPLLAASLTLSGCGPRGPGRPGTAGPDSSFSAVAFQRGQSPESLSVAQGRVLYGRYCAICHGETGDGDGFNAYNVQAAFGVAPSAFTDSATFHALREDTALAAIRDGGPAVGRSPAMPPWGHTLTPGEVVEVWQYVRFLSRTAPRE